MKLQPGATPDEIASARVELATALTGEQFAARAGGRRAALIAAVVFLALTATAALVGVWLDDQVSSAVWWAMLVLLSVALVFLLGALGTLAIATWPRIASDREVFEHLPIISPGVPPESAAQNLVEVASEWHQHAARVASRLALATALTSLAGAMLGVMAVVHALGVRYYEPAKPKAAITDPMVRAALDFAPRVWLHPAEPYGPLDPAAFIHGSALRWRRPGGDALIDRAPVNPETLGVPCERQHCATFGPYLSPQLTRPFTRDPRLRPRRLPLSRGMYLELDDRLRRGQLLSDPPVRTFYAIKDSEITYWLFFGATRRFARPPRVAREGDWERITIRLDHEHRPAAAVLPIGDGAVPWHHVTTTKDGHPILFASLERHALFHTPCALPRTNTCRTHPRARGLRWDTWKMLEDVAEQPWFGFGGAWGHAGARSDLTGPLGPR
ncbi:MAG: hypothetical protein DYH12_18180 [Sorangiineae bacterium PRO1]|nr:hypothetical protein [Sorangiineae bacterium PRO1]